MKRAILMILIILACILGFLFAGGIFPSAPASDSGLESVLSLLFQSQYSVIYTLVFLLLLGSILFRQELARLIRVFYLRISGPPVSEEVYTEPELTSRIKLTEQKMADTEQALNRFSRAIERYAAHLSSHTGAIQGLNAASQELQKGAAQQNRVLMKLMENAENPPAAQKKTPHWRIDPPPLEPQRPVPQTPRPPTPEPQTDESRTTKHPAIHVEEKGSFPPGCARNRRKKPEESPIIKTEKFPDTSSRMPEEMTIEPESLLNVQKHVAELRAKAGKTRSRKTLAEEALAAEAEIMKAIRNLNAQLDKSEFQE
jgi:hypothetical protein